MQKQDHESDDEYKQQLQDLTQLIEQHAEYSRLLPTLPAEARAEAAPILRQLGDAIENLEQKLAEKNEIIQKQKKLELKNLIKKEDAAENLWENMERIFIVAKHKGDKEFFEKFEAQVTGKMTSEAKEEFYDRVAIRESYDLQNILANPGGKPKYKKSKMKHPQIQMIEALYEINKVAYETDDFFKEIDTQLKENIAIRDRYVNKIQNAPTAKRGQMRAKAADLTRKIEAGKAKLMEYLDMCLAEEKIEIENPDQKKLDAAFKQAGIASERIYLMCKHTQPHLLEDYTKQCIEEFSTPEEVSEFFERVAKREAEELDDILESLD
jgi:hypothetical protein